MSTDNGIQSGPVEQPNFHAKPWAQRFRALLIIVFVLVFLSLCSLPFWLLGGLWSGTAQAQPREAETWREYTHDPGFPVLSNADRSECLRRGWRLMGIQLAAGQVVWECHGPNYLGQGGGQ
jgi:hypothetical protein